MNSQVDICHYRSGDSILVWRPYAAHGKLLCVPLPDSRPLQASGPLDGIQLVMLRVSINEWLCQKQEVEDERLQSDTHLHGSKSQ